MSIITIYVAMAFSKETSSFSVYLFYEFIQSYSTIFLLFVVFIIFAVRYSKYSIYFYSIASFVTAFILLAYIYENFNKAILFIIFFYCVLAYFLGQGWKQVLSFSCYNPNMLKNELDDPISIKIKVKVTLKDEMIHEGVLTNWDEISCFVHLGGKIEEKLYGQLKIQTEYNGKVFENEGKIVSRVANQGIGVIFNIDEEKRFNWQDFYKIMDEASLTPQYLIL
ncbi:MAG: hypothetical protein OXB88_09035 [Bacteriovoracales bacterium]|nr:hypothetical protein [Bacteriovoracales bacterium]